MKEKLVLLLDEYPFTTGEYSFIRTELSCLLEYFEVSIISTSSSVEQEMEIDGRIRLYHCIRKFGWKEKLEACIKFVISGIGRRELADIIRKKENILKRVYDSLSFFSCALQLRKFTLENSILSSANTGIIYSYWFNANCLAFLMEKTSYSGWKVISRIHGYDLYEERNANKRQPFRNEMDRLIDRIYFVGEEGKKYYLARWGRQDEEKYRVSPIGTINRSKKINLERTDSRKSFRIVSCSNVISLKRVDLIAEAIAQIEGIFVEWIHFGDGELFGKVNSRAHTLLDKKENICYEMKGRVPVEEIMEYYEKKYVDCFLMASSTEGCPVSIQEAMSYGIPIVATAVGEIPNMISQNGVLLKVNPTAIEIRDAVYWICSRNKEETRNMREQSRKLWEERYDAYVNSTDFVEELGMIRG